MIESNKNANKQDTRLEDQEQIVNQYLDELLREVDEYRETDTKTEVVQETVDVITIAQDQEIAQADEPQALVAEYEQIVDGEIEGQEERPAPDWAQEPFQCLIFRVGDICLATPLLALDNIIKWDTKLTPMPFQPEWHMGVMQNRDDKVVIVDTAKLLKLDQSQDDSGRERIGSHILIIGDHHFGLACDSLAKPLLLHKEDVHWSIKHEDRPWMAGTIKEKLILLLDMESLLQIIRHE